MKKSIILILWPSIFLFFCLGCTKEVTSEDSESASFFRKFGSTYSDYNTAISTSDDGFIMAGSSSTADALGISYVSNNGKLLWEKNIQLDKFSVFPNILKLSNEDFIINDMRNSYITGVNKNGNISFRHSFDPNLWNGFTYSPLIQDANGNCFLSMTDGGAKGSESDIYISQISPNSGQELEYFGYADFQFGGKVIMFNIIKAEAGSFWMCGAMFEYNPWWNWGDRIKLFVTKTTGWAVDKVLVFGSKDDNTQEMPHCYTSTIDGNMVIASGTQNWFYAPMEDLDDDFTLRKIDNNLQELWNKKISLNASFLAPYSIKNITNGNVSITGLCLPHNQNTNAGFVMIVNSSGDVISSHIFNLGTSHGFYSSEFTPTNEWIFTGRIDGFGKNKEESERFYLKTDEDFNY